MKAVSRLIDLHQFYMQFDSTQIDNWLPQSSEKHLLYYKPSVLNESLVAWQDHLTTINLKMKRDLVGLADIFRAWSLGLSSKNSMLFSGTTNCFRNCGK